MHDKGFFICLEEIVKQKLLMPYLKKIPPQPALSFLKAISARYCNVSINCLFDNEIIPCFEEFTKNPRESCSCELQIFSGKVNLVLPTHDIESNVCFINVTVNLSEPINEKRHLNLNRVFCKTGHYNLDELSTTVSFNEKVCDAHEGLKLTETDEPNNDLDEQLMEWINIYWGDESFSCLNDLFRCTQYRLHEDGLLEKKDTYFVEISSSVVEWLDQDCFITPNKFFDDPSGFYSSVSTDFSDSECSKNSSVINSETESVKLTEFKDMQLFTSCVHENLEALNREVFIKLDWSAPKDIMQLKPYMNLKHSCIRDVIESLKMSENLQDDLDGSFCYKSIMGSNLEEHTPRLMMKKWKDYTEAYEFRVYFFNDKLLGISQRDLTTELQKIINDGLYHESLLDTVQTFFGERFYPKLRQARKSAIIQGAFDIAVFGKTPKLTIQLIDVSPWGGRTDCLLFTWKELRIRAFNKNSVNRNDLLRLVSRSWLKSQPQPKYIAPLDASCYPIETQESFENYLKKNSKSGIRKEDLPF